MSKTVNAFLGLFLLSGPLVFAQAPAPALTNKTDSASVTAVANPTASTPVLLPEKTITPPSPAPSPEAAKPAPVQTVKNWTEGMKWEGDLRFRHEYISATPTPASQHRQRIRARLALGAKLSSDTSTLLQLSTGSSDPISGNQTLDDGFTRKSIGLDLAQIEWAAAEGFTFWAGKMKNPLFRPGSSQIIFDNDLNPEGLAMRFETKFDDLTFTWNVPAFWVDERANAWDSALLGSQFILAYKMEGTGAFKAGIAYLTVTNSKGFGAFGDTSNANTAAGFGNSVSGGKYLNHFNLIEAFAEFGTDTMDPPLAVFLDYVVNSGASTKRVAAYAGLTVGKVKKPGSWSARYGYRHVEADAVVGAFSDSDFRGGGTDTKGHELGAEYGLADFAKVGFSYLYASKGVSAILDYHRVMADISLKF